MKIHGSIRKSRAAVSAAGVAALALAVAASGPINAQTAIGTMPQTDHFPLIRTSQGDSLNWSGYAVSIANVTSVTGTFIVPTVKQPGSIDGLQPDMSAWVGIDGYTSGTVEQTGVAGTWDDATGKAVYYAWWEMYPRSSATIRSMAISAGDLITASVVYNGGGSFTLSISDNTTGQSFTTTTFAPVGGADVALRNSAEWVVERAATIYKGYLTILPLATFEDPGVGFTDAAFTTGNGSPTTLQDAIDQLPQYAGYPDTAPPPSMPYWEQMIMVGLDSNNNPYPLDSISSAVDNSFNALFLDNGAPLPIPGAYRQ